MYSNQINSSSCVLTLSNLSMSLRQAHTEYYDGKIYRSGMQESKYVQSLTWMMFTGNYWCRKQVQRKLLSDQGLGIGVNNWSHPKLFLP